MKTDIDKVIDTFMFNMNEQAEKWAQENQIPDHLLDSFKLGCIRGALFTLLQQINLTPAQVAKMNEVNDRLFI